MSEPLVTATIAEIRSDVCKAAEVVFQKYDFEVRKLPASKSDKFPIYASRFTDSNIRSLRDAYLNASWAANKAFCIYHRDAYRFSGSHGYLYLVDAREEEDPSIDDAEYDKGVRV